MRKQIGSYVIFMGICLGVTGCASREDTMDSSEGSIWESSMDESASMESSSEERSTEESNMEESSDMMEDMTDRDDDMDESDDDDEDQDGIVGDDDGLLGRAVDVLTNIWDNYADEDRFSAAGGDSANTVSDAPGSFDITNTDALSTQLIFPSEHADKIDDAASLMHTTNSNTFTGGVYHVTDTENVKVLADALKDSIENTQWVSDFPDRLIIADIGDGYVLAAFGEEEVMTTFKARLVDTYGASEILYDEALNQ